VELLNKIVASIVLFILSIHSIYSGYFYSASTSPLLRIIVVIIIYGQHI